LDEVTIKLREKAIYGQSTSTAMKNNKDVTINIWQGEPAITLIKL